MEANRRAALLFVLGTPGAVVGRQITDLTHEEDRWRFRQYFNRGCSDRVAASAWELRLAQPWERWVALQMQVATDQRFGGHCCAVLIDVTDRVLAQEEVVRLAAIFSFRKMRSSAAICAAGSSHGTPRRLRSLDLRAARRRCGALRRRLQELPVCRRPLQHQLECGVPADSIWLE